MILEKALKRATTDKGISYYSLSAELRKAGTDAAKLTSTLAAGGQKFAASLNAANNALALSNRNVIALNSKIKEAARVLTQSFKFTAAQTFIQNFSNQIQEAVRWTTQLYDAVNQIGIVTGKSGEELRVITENSIVAAKNLRIAAKEYAEGSLIFYQQGLDDDEVAKRTEIAVKSAKAAGESLSQMSSELTSIWNNYKMVGDEQARAASVGAKMAAQTAVDFSDIAEAMQTAAAPAAQMGVSYNSLAAIIATVGDTTQQSASVIGNAFKTIFSRFQQLKAEGTDGEVTLNRVSTQLQQLGVNVLDAAGELRPLDDVINEVGQSWDNWSTKQQLAIAQLVGGTRQYGQFLALMNNFDKYQNNLNAAISEDGSTLDQQYEQYTESIESYAENAAEAWNRAFGQAFDPETIKTFYKLVEVTGNGVNSLIQGLGGIPGILMTVGAILSSKIVPTLMKAGSNAKVFVQNLTPEGRKKGIEADFNNQLKANQMQQSKASSKEDLATLQIQKQKIEYSKQTAILNDEINTKLATATGAYKINLEYQKQQLSISQQIYQQELDKIALLEKEASKENQRINDRQVDNATTLKEKADKANRAEDNYFGAKVNLEENSDNIKGAERAQRLKELAALEKEAASAQEEYNQALNRVNADKIIKVRNEVTKAIASLNRGTLETDELRKALAEAGITGEKADKALEEFAKGNLSDIIKLVDSVDTLGDEFNDVIAARERMDASMNSSETVGVQRQKQKEISQQGEQTDFNITEEDLKPIDYAGIASGLTEISMSAGLAATALTSLFDILGNDQLSFGEKLLALLPIVSQLIFSITTIAQGLSKVSTLIKGVTLAQTQSAAASAALTAARQAEAIATNQLAAAEERLKIAKDGTISNSKREKLTGVGGGRGSAIRRFTAERDQAKQAADAAKAARETAEKTAEAAAGNTLKGTVKGLGTKALSGVKSLISLISKIPPQAAIAAAAIAGVAIAAKFLYDEFKNREPEAQLKRQKEAVQHLQQNLEKAKEKADALKNSIESYDSATQKINELSKGTEEFASALSDANTKALQLLEQLSEVGINIAGIYERNEDGLIIINEDKLNEAQDQMRGIIAQQEYAVQLAKTRQMELQANVDARSKAKELDLNMQGIQLFRNDNKLAGNAIYKNIDALAGAKDTNEFMEELNKAGISLDSFDGTIEELQIEVQKLAIAMENAEQQMEISARNMVEDVLGGDYSNEVKDAMGQMANRMADDTSENYKKQMDILNSFNKAGIFDIFQGDQIDEIVKTYNEATGQNLKASSNFARGTDSNRTFVMEDEEGKEVEIRAEELAAIMASTDALSDLEAKAKEAAASMSQLEQSNIKFGENGQKQGIEGEDFSKFLQQGDFSETSQENLKYYATMTRKEITDSLMEGFNVKTEEELNAKAKQFGFDSASQMVDEMEKGIDEATKDLDKVGENLGRRSKAIFESLQSSGKLDKLNFKELNQVSSMISAAMVSGGEEGAEQMKEILSQVDPEDLPKVLQEMEGIDWSTISPDQLIEKLEEAGIATDAFADKLPELISLMKEAAKIDFEGAQEKYAKISKYQNLNYGDTVNQEDIDAMEAAGLNTSDYFEEMADGSYMLVESADKFKETVDSISMEGFNDVYGNLLEQQQGILDFQKSGYNYNQIATSGYSSSLEWGGFDKGFQRYEDKNYQLANAQLDYLQGVDAIGQGIIDPSQMAEWQEGINSGNLSPQEFNDIADAIKNCGDQTDSFNEKLNSTEQEMQQVKDTVWMQDFQDSVEESDLEMEAVLEYADYLQEAADESDLLSDSLKDNDKASKLVARDVMKMNQGIEDLAEGFEDWSDILEKSDEGSQEYNDALRDMQGALSDVLGVSEDFISDDWIAENMEDIAKAAEGDEEAIDRLKASMAEDILLRVVGETDFSNIDTDIANLHSRLMEMNPSIEVGAQLNDGDFLTAANELVTKAGMTADEAQAYFNSIGYEPTFKTETKKVTTMVPRERTHTDWELTTSNVSIPVPEVLGGPWNIPVPSLDSIKTVTQEAPVPVEQTIEVPALSADGTPVIESLTKTSSGTMNNYSGANSGGPSKPGKKSSGGGGSKPKHQAIKAKKYESMKKDDRYSTIKASIEEVQKSLDKYNDAVDDSWGSAKIRALQQANRELERQAKDYQALYKSAKSYLSIDQKEAAKNKKDLGKKLGLNLIDPTFNKDGFLSNKTEVINQLDDYLQALYQKYYDAAQKYDADKSTDEKRKEQIDQMLEEYNVAKEAVDEYITSLDQVDETANEAYEALMKLVEGIRQEIANRVEEITYKMEFRIKINDRDIEWFEHIIDKMGDVGLITGKSFEQIVKSFNSSANSVQTAADTFEDLQDLLASLNTKEGQQDFIAKFGQEAWDYYLATGKLSAEVIEGMSDVYDQAFDALNQAYDDFDAMFEQYLSLLDIYLSEFDRFSNQISRQSDQLEAYRQLLDFSGKGYGEDGRAARKSLSDAQISNAKTELARAQSVAKMLEGSVKDSEERLQKFYDTYGKDPSGWDTATAHAFNQIKQTHDEIVSQYEDAQSDITAALTDVIDAATEALEDGHERITEAFVEGFNGLFTSLDSALTQYEWKTDIRDFYLDDYDKNYELDKLLGEIDDAMTDVTDPERLQAWGALQDEINAKMAEGVKITQTDLDILRAQFELEQAKDQYEEAKNAKNTMRLARDASGNWNYVYSSESSEAEDAEQKMKDAMANIHKMHREAADSMSDLWYQTYIEMEKYEYEVDQLRYKNDEQYRAEVDEFRRLYKEKLDFYESEVIKHNGAIDRSFADTVLGQQTGYETMEEAADAYYQANEQYTKELQDNANEYEETIRETCDRVGISYEELEQWVRDRANNIMQSNDDMAEKMEETSIRGSTALGNLSDNIDTYAWSMIESLRALELQVESLYNTLQNLSNWEADVGMNADFGTDYTDYIGTDFYNKYGKGATANDVKDYMNSAEVQQLIKERLYIIQNDSNRGDLHDPKAVYEDVYNEVYNSLMAILKDIQNDKGYWTDDNWDFGENGSAKKKRTASGGLIKTPQVRSLAEEGPELVLNKDDTQNILEAVKNMRETIKLKISAMNSSIGQRVQGETIATQSNVETIEQNVKIDATFPGVSVASEIEEALNNLINQAVQYAHKNNR